MLILSKSPLHHTYLAKTSGVFLPVRQSLITTDTSARPLASSSVSTRAIGKMPRREAAMCEVYNRRQMIDCILTRSTTKLAQILGTPVHRYAELLKAKDMFSS